MWRGRFSWPSARRSLMSGISSLSAKFLSRNPLISRRAGAIMPRGLSPRCFPVTGSHRHEADAGAVSSHDRFRFAKDGESWPTTI